MNKNRLAWWSVMPWLMAFVVSLAPSAYLLWGVVYPGADFAPWVHIQALEGVGGLVVLLWLAGMVAAFKAKQVARVRHQNSMDFGD